MNLVLLFSTAIIHHVVGLALLWRQVIVETSWLNSTTIMKNNLTLVPMRCAITCMTLSWCETWCHDGVLGCQPTNLIVAGSHQTNNTNISVCYTRRSLLPEYAFGASITSSLLTYARPLTNLVDGIYNWDVSFCPNVNYIVSYPWFLLDLKRPVSITKIILIAQPNSYAAVYFHNFEVRVGATQQTGNFTSYTLLGTFIGPGKINQSVSMVSPQPIVGQYVSIQMTVSGYLAICHLEIY